MKSFDAVVVGAGVGGLAVAALLSKVHQKRILVLEKHLKPGGFTHTFRRKGSLEFDVGVHYVGGLTDGSELRTVLDFLSGGKLKWKQLPYEFERLQFDDFEWAIPSDANDHLQRLQKRFPLESAALEKFFWLEKQSHEAYGLWQYSEKFSGPMRALSRVYVRLRNPFIFKRTQEVLDRYFQSEELKSILGARWMGFGLPPSLSSFGIHSVHSAHYAQGAWYPEGGGSAIADSLIEPILASGGEVITGAAVKSIDVEDGKVTGVTLEKSLKSGETRIDCPIVISNVGARQTYLGLLDSQVQISFREKLRESDPGTSVISLFMGLNSSPRQMGFEAVNYWLMPEGKSQLFDPENQDSRTSFLSFPSLKQGTSNHSAQLLVMTGSDFFKKWQDSKWRRRPENYDRWKDDLIKILVAELDARFPGFKNQISYSELSTPLSVEHFHGLPGGAIYGVPSDSSRFSAPWARTRTPIKGLYLTGSDTFAPGISGALYGALKTFEITAPQVRARP